MSFVTEGVHITPADLFLFQSLKGIHVVCDLR